MSSPSQHSTSRNTKAAIARRFIVFSVYRLFSLTVVGSLPLVAHTLISMQLEGPENRTWVAPELWLLSLVMWGTTFGDVLAQKGGDLRRSVFGWGSVSGLIGSAYAYGSLMVHAPAAKGLNQVFQRWPIHATIVAVLAFAILHAPELSAKAAVDAAEEKYK
jgi:hypothetical protein